MKVHFIAGERRSVKKIKPPFKSAIDIKNVVAEKVKIQKN